MQIHIKRHLATLACALALAACASPGPVSAGYYRVQGGDTLSLIAMRYHITVRDLVRWNHLNNPNLLEVDQILRVVPPAEPFGGGDAAHGAPSPAYGSAPAPSNSAHARLAAPPTPHSTDEPAAAAKPATSIALVWPAQGPIIARYNADGDKGIDIGGNPGTPVFAAAAGRVVYAGNGLRGYGNLLIIKHNADYLTAYAHNSKLLVKEGQSVTAGEQVAEMGNTDSDRVMLHFELRYQGRTIDPQGALPPH